MLSSLNNFTRIYQLTKTEKRLWLYAHVLWRPGIVALCFPCTCKLLLCTLLIVTTRKRSLGRGNVFTSVCHSVHGMGRGCIPECNGAGWRSASGSRGCTLPRQTPPIGRHPSDTPSRQTPLGQTPSLQMLNIGPIRMYILMLGTRNVECRTNEGCTYVH